MSCEVSKREGSARMILSSSSDPKRQGRSVKTARCVRKEPEQQVTAAASSSFFLLTNRPPVRPPPRILFRVVTQGAFKAERAV